MSSKSAKIHEAILSTLTIIIYTIERNMAYEIAIESKKLFNFN